MKPYEVLPITSLVPQFENWKKILEHNQVCHIFFMPHTGMLYRVNQFRDWLAQSGNHDFNIVNMDSDLVSEPLSFKSFLKTMNKQLILVAKGNFFGNNRMPLSNILQTHYVDNKAGIIVLHEGSPIAMKTAREFPSVMFQNHLIYSLPTDPVVIGAYIASQSKLWKIEVSTIEIDEIVQYCGNQPWLINEVLRLKDLSINKSIAEIIKSSSVSERIAQLWELLPDNYREYFFKTLSDSAQIENIENELVSFGYLSAANLAPTGEWLDSAISSNHMTALKISDDSIVYNQQNMTGEFSPGELRIISKLSGSNKPVSREEIAHDFWLDKADDQFTDWALDAIMSRLRKKLSRLHLPIKIITKRGLGYGTA